MIADVVWLFWHCKNSSSSSSTNEQSFPLSEARTRIRIRKALLLSMVQCLLFTKCTKTTYEDKLEYIPRMDFENALNYQVRA